MLSGAQQVCKNKEILKSSGRKKYFLLCTQQKDLDAEKHIIHIIQQDGRNDIIKAQLNSVNTVA